MSHSAVSSLKRRLLELIKKDDEFRLALIGALSEGFITRTEYRILLDELKKLREDFNKYLKELVEMRNEIMALREDFNRQFELHSKAIEELRADTNSLRREITQLREDFNRQFELHSKAIEELRADTNSLRREITQLREDFNKRFEFHSKVIEELRDDFNKRLEEHSREIKNLWTEIKNLREDMQKGFEYVRKDIYQLHRLVTVVGGRWGIKAEKAFRDAMIDLVKDAVGAEVERITLYDEEGIVYGEPSNIEIDLAIRDKKHILVEIKSRIRKSDVTELLKIAEVYTKKTNIVPELVIVAPEIDKNAYDFAIKKNIRVYSIAEELSST